MNIIITYKLMKIIKSINILQLNAQWILYKPKYNYINTFTKKYTTLTAKFCDSSQFTYILIKIQFYFNSVT